MKPAALKLIFNVLALGLALALGLSLALRGASANEALRQEAVGRIIATRGSLPSTDVFSYGQGTQVPFNLDGWGYAVGLFGLSQAVGSNGPSFVRAASLLLCLCFLLATGFRRQARPFSTALFSLWALLAVVEPKSGPAAWSGVTGLALCSACLFVMEGPFWEAFFARWVWLPLLAVLWVNLDSGALLLLPLAWIWAFAERQPDSPQVPEHPLLSRVLVLSLLSACLFLHPALWRLPLDGVDWAVASPFAAGHFAQAELGLGMLALAFLVLVSTSWLGEGRAHLGRDAWIFIFFGLASLLWPGLLPYACLWAAPMLAARSDLLVDALPEPLRLSRWLLKVGLLGLGFWMLPGLLARPMLASAQARPSSTLGFMQSELLDGNVFTEEAWAGPVLLAVAPGMRVFEEDGMLPAARARAAAEAARVQDLEPKLSADGKEAWENILEHSATDFALLKLASPLAKAMARSAYWQPVDFDDAAVLYARVTPEHAQLIKTYAPRGLRPGDLDEPFDSSRLPQVEADLEERLLAKPKLGILYYFEALLWKQRGRQQLARQWLEKGLREDPGFSPNYRLLGDLRGLAGDAQGGRKFLDKAAAMDAESH